MSGIKKCQNCGTITKINELDICSTIVRLEEVIKELESENKRLRDAFEEIQLTTTIEHAQFIAKSALDLKEREEL